MMGPGRREAIGGWNTDVMETSKGTPILLPGVYPVERLA
jgi:hypothetical protein